MYLGGSDIWVPRSFSSSEFVEVWHPDLVATRIRIVTDDLAGRDQDLGATLALLPGS
jgi:hypothetical protein